MKKILSFLIAFTMLAGVVTVSAGAADEATDGTAPQNTQLDEPEEIIKGEISEGDLDFDETTVPDDAEKLLYKDKFDACYPESLEYVVKYDELFYHYQGTDGGETETLMSIDWALVYADTSNPAPSVVYAVFGDRVLAGIGDKSPFSTCYGVYDVNDGRFYDICYVWDNEKYEGLQDAFNALKVGRLIGDMDNDGKLSVLDATYIQKCLAGLRDYPADDAVAEQSSYSLLGELSYISDFNRDGTRSVLDATAVQKRLAGLE